MSNLVVSRDVKVSKDFKLREFSSKDGSKEIKLDYRLVKKLQELRDWIGQPILITSGYRSPNHNTKVGGAKASQHLLGTAADIQIKGIDPKTVAKYAQELGFTGIGIYPNFTHVDVREKESKWGDWNGVNSKKLKPRPSNIENDVKKLDKIKINLHGQDLEVDGIIEDLEGKGNITQFIPVKFLEQLDLKTDWDNKAKKVLVTYK